MFNEKPVGIGRKSFFCTLPIRVSCLFDPPLPDVLRFKININLIFKLILFIYKGIFLFFLIKDIPLDIKTFPD